MYYFPIGRLENRTYRTIRRLLILKEIKVAVKDSTTKYTSYCLLLSYQTFQN